MSQIVVKSTIILSRVINLLRLMTWSSLSKQNLAMKMKAQTCSTIIFINNREVSTWFFPFLEISIKFPSNYCLLSSNTKESIGYCSADFTVPKTKICDDVAGMPFQHRPYPIIIYPMDENTLYIFYNISYFIIIYFL